MKKVFALIAALAFSALALAGCGSQQSASSGASSAASGAKTLKVGATAVPHAEILEAAKPLLEKEGITLEIVEFNDYVQPNKALAEGDLDMNSMQHQPYMDNVVKKQGLKITSIGKTIILPMAVYSHKFNRNKIRITKSLCQCIKVKKLPVFFSLFLGGKCCWKSFHNIINFPLLSKDFLHKVMAFQKLICPLFNIGLYDCYIQRSNCGNNL